MSQMGMFSMVMIYQKMMRTSLMQDIVIEELFSVNFREVFGNNCSSFTLQMWALSCKQTAVYTCMQATCILPVPTLER